MSKTNKQQKKKDVHLNGMTAHWQEKKKSPFQTPTHPDNTLTSTHQRSCHVLASMLTAELITCLTGPAASQLLGEGRTWEVWSSQLLAEGSRHTHRSFSPFYNLRSHARMLSLSARHTRSHVLSLTQSVWTLAA